MAKDQHPVSVQLVLVTGESAAGKTRAVVEAMQAELPDWRLFIPLGARRLASAIEAEEDFHRTVVWLDEIQDLIGLADGVELLQGLLSNPVLGPTVLLATIRTDAEAARKGSVAWRLLDRRAIRVPLRRRPDRRELRQAGELDDPWISEALTKIGNRYGIAEYLAAGPQLVRQLDRARAEQPHAAAIVDAAIDLHHAGFTIPLPVPLLYETHQYYLDTNQPGQTGQDSFEEALDWARQPVSGASALLEYTAQRGDQAFDYLLDRARPSGSEEAIKFGIWAAALRHATPAVLTTIALAAFRNNHLGIVQECAIRCTDEVATASLLNLLGDEEALSRRADRGDGVSAQFLAGLLLARGDVAGLALRAERGEQASEASLAELLSERNDLDELTKRAQSGDRSAERRAASLFKKSGNIDELAKRAAQGYPVAAELYAEILRSGDLHTDAPEHSLKVDPKNDEFREQGRRDVTHNSVVHHGSVKQFLGLGEFAPANERLDFDELTLLADNGDPEAEWQLASLLAARHDVEQLTRRAESGDTHAEAVLSSLLLDMGERQKLERLAERSNDAALHLIELLVARGDISDLSKRADNGDRRAADRLGQYLADRGDTHRLTHRANNGDRISGWHLASLLAARGDYETLALRAASGDAEAGWHLTHPLPRSKEFRARHLTDATIYRESLFIERAYDRQLNSASSHEVLPSPYEQVEVLAEQEEIDVLIEQADQGEELSAITLAILLAERGGTHLLIHRADNGDETAASVLAMVLAQRDNLTELRNRSNFGDARAAAMVARMESWRQYED